MIFGTVVYENEQRICYIDSIKQTFSILSDFKSDMLSFIENYDYLEEKISYQIKSGALLQIPFARGRFLSPIPYPRRNIVCLGKNYLDHVKEIVAIAGGPKDRAPDYPIYFTKASTPCNNPFGTILRHAGITSQIDYEVELGIVIGKKGINIPVCDAENYIFGYTIGNDVSARDLQQRHVNWFKGKSLVSHCPIGPWIVEKSELPLPLKLKIQSYVNGELRQNGNTSDLIFDIPSIISDLSQGYELLPGDIILTGTPAGVGMSFSPPKYLQPGDEIRCVIEGIGELVNYVEK